MRRVILGAVAVFGATLGVASSARAATLVIYADPMTFETRHVVVDPKGPDRTFLCLMPPSQAGCHEVKRKKR